MHALYPSALRPSLRPPSLPPPMLQEEGDLTEQELDTLVATEAVNAPSFVHSASGGREGPSSSGANGAAADESSSPTGAGRASAGGGAKTGDGGPAPRGLVEVDLRQLDGVTYSKSEGKAPGGMLGRMLQELEGMELGKRVKKVGTARGGGGGVGDFWSAAEKYGWVGR